MPVLYIGRAKGAGFLFIDFARMDWSNNFHRETLELAYRITLM